jgi:two-component system chemotaxis response regulator CheB
MSRIRVLVVDDSLTVRKRLVEVLSADPELEVVGEAADGKRAIELCGQLRPDVITLDMVLPVMSGLAVTEYVMAHFATPIVIVSSSLNRGEVFKTLDALAAGAVDVFEKPSGDYDERWDHEFVATVKLVSRIRVITHPRAKLRGTVPAVAPLVSRPPARAGKQAGPVIAIGASTGGPAALVQVFRALPSDFPIPILLAIHIGSAFAPAFIEWLDSQSPLRVAFAQHDQPLPRLGQPGVVVAPADRHLVIERGALRLSDAPERHSCRPSVDVLFESVAREIASNAVACLMTGMGRDGAEGLLAVRRAGGHTLAQDEASSVVFGMNREAIQLDAARDVLPLDKIAPAFVAIARALPAQGGVLA